MPSLTHDNQNLSPWIGQQHWNLRTTYVYSMCLSSVQTISQLDPLWCLAMAERPKEISWLRFNYIPRIYMNTYIDTTTTTALWQTTVLVIQYHTIVTTRPEASYIGLPYVYDPIHWFRNSNCDLFKSWVTWFGVRELPQATMLSQPCTNSQ
jgi:hypothetical protein